MASGRLARAMPIAAAMAAFMATGAAADTVGLKPELAGIGFLVGHWRSGKGTVAETGGTSRGSSDVTIEVGGAVLLRRDHVDLFDAAGKPAGGFDQIMMIYAEDGSIHAEYSDGTHLIHYKTAAVVPGHSLVLTSAAAPDAPTFRLGYELKSAGTLDVSFAMAGPGQSDFHPIAVGTLRKAG